MKYFALILSLFLCASGLFAQTQNDAVVFYQLKDALWNQTATVAKDSGTPGDKNGAISGSGVTFVNNGGGGTAVEYSITTNDAKIDGVTADWGEKFVLEARLKRSALEDDGTNSEIHILKNVVTTGLDWFINTDGKMVLKVGDGSSINIISQDVALTDDSWTTLAVAVDLSQASLADAVKFFRNGAGVGTGSEEPVEPVLNEVVFDEEFTQRNFNAEPLTISSLEGDSYDYTLIMYKKDNSTSSRMRLTFNSDNSSNYRNYYMYGSATTKSAAVSDSESYLSMWDYSNSRPSLFQAQITGVTGNERYVNSISMGAATTNARINKLSGYWKNTNDEIESLTLTNAVSSSIDAHVRVYRTPKLASNDSWELIDSGSLSQDIFSNPLNISGLNGDEDKKYKLVIKNFYVSSGYIYPLVQINGDSNHLNYGVKQILHNGNGSISSQKYTDYWTGLHFGQPQGSTRSCDVTFIINAETGSKRLVTQSLSQKNPAGGYFCQEECTHWYKDISTNITSLKITTPSSSNVVFEYELFKQKDPTGVADKYNLPFEVVEAVDINGDFSAGHTFSNLTGDSEFMYKLEFLGTAQTSETILKAEFNNDSTSNYQEQTLLGYGSGVTATSPTRTYLPFGYPQPDKPTSVEKYIFPKSGAARPMLNSFCYGEAGVGIDSQWWNNTSDEILSIRVFGSNTNTVTGKLILSKIPLSFTPAQDPEPPVVGSGASEKIFDQTFTARNFNTNPLVISGLQGDTFDYEMIVKLDNNTGATSNFYTNPNSDEGANYRDYYLHAQGSSPSAYIFESDNFARWGGQGGSTTLPLLSRISFTGSSGSERLISALTGGYNAVNTFIRKNSFYWKNTQDELTSILFKNQVSTNTDKVHVLVYAIPKSGDRGNWQLVDEVEFSGRNLLSNPIDYSGLNGDVDKEYKIELFSNDARDYSLRVNGDTGSNYVNQRLQNSSGSIGSLNTTTNKVYGSTYSHNVNYSIQAESSQKRIINTSTSYKGAAYQQTEMATWWNNTSDNITSLTVFAEDSTAASGTVKLYKRKDPTSTGADLHWETIETVPVNGDFSAGHTFSGLTGDSEDLLKIEFVGSGPSSVSKMRIQYNGDSSSSYVDQILSSEASTVNAISTSNSYIEFLDLFDGTSQGTLTLYPKSGSSRPSLQSCSDKLGPNSYKLWKKAQWWNNSVDEINSIKVFASNSNVITGTLKLSRLVDPPIVVEDEPVLVGQLALDESSIYTTGIYPTISGENAIEMLTKTGDFSLYADFIKMTLKRTDGAFDAANIQIGEGYRVDGNYNVLTPTASQILVYPPKLLRRVYNPPTDFDTLGRPKAGVTVDIASSPVVSKVYYGLFQFEFALDKALSENVTVDVFMKTSDFDFKKIAEVKPTAKPADPEAAWIIKYYWNSRLNQFDWNGGAYKTSGAVEFKFEVR